MAKIEFTTRLVPMGPGGAWVFANFPKGASEQLGSKGRVPIRGTINGFPFRSSAFPTGDGTHQISVNKAMREGAKAGPGDTVRLVLDVDTSTRTVRVPADLKKALAASAAARTNFETLAWSHRKAYVDWIAEAKRPETRARRIAQAIERLSQGRSAFT